jgi:adenylate cyclase
MTPVAWGVAATLSVLLVACVAVLLGAWRRAKRLRERLDAASVELERLERAFARFAPPAVVERVIARGVSTQGERKEVTVLFADLVGFTPLTERVDPRVLVRILNGYFERMSRAISEHQGHISTLIGDGILALFGAVEPNPWQSNDATHAALAMRAALAAYNRELAADGLPALAVGIGLHRGTGVAGLVGSQDLVQFTVVGSTVTIAARVQDLTRAHGVDILATQPVRAALDPRFALRPLPPGVLRGIAEPMPIWAVEDFVDARRTAGHCMARDRSLVKPSRGDDSRDRHGA